MSRTCLSTLTADTQAGAFKVIAHGTIDIGVSYFLLEFAVFRFVFVVPNVFSVFPMPAPTQHLGLLAKKGASEIGLVVVRAMVQLVYLVFRMGCTPTLGSKGVGMIILATANGDCGQ